MGNKDHSVDSGSKTVTILPEHNEVEVSLFGPGYGECILLHIGKGNWVIVDSCVNAGSQPTALDYLSSLDLNPARVVRFVIATHWHDDHIRGMGKLVEICHNATFCCASTLCKEEFLSAVGAMGSGPVSAAGSGIEEVHKVFSLLEKRSAQPIFALANRLIFKQESCEIWSLSPSDEEFAAFLQDIGNLMPKERETKRRISALTPNKVAVVLLVKIDDEAILLGSDLESHGWLKILDAHERPNYKASAFKIPHHGSQNAHKDRVWSEMLYNEPVAALTPWKLCGRMLPTKSDVQRILSFTPKAFTTAAHKDLTGKPVRSRHKMVEKTIKETGIRFWRTNLSSGMIRMRRKLGSGNDWDIQMAGTARNLADLL